MVVGWSFSWGLVDFASGGGDEGGEGDLAEFADGAVVFA
jgi:hypothetical protein